jgi:hypothetical protein
MSWKACKTVGNPSQLNNYPENGVAAEKQKVLDTCDNLRQAGMGNLAAMNDKEAEGSIDLASNDNDDTKPAAQETRKLYVVGSTTMVVRHA